MQWLRSLILEGHLPRGDVDTRSIVEVRRDDLRGYTQCYFFAGIGGWPLALQLAGWPGSRPVWTGSCPRQPFSSQGARNGLADKRHLWPDWFDLIKEREPDIIFGEQVDEAIREGWLETVRRDLESIDYAVAPFVLSSRSAGGTHERYRPWFIADTAGIERMYQPATKKPSNDCLTTRLLADQSLG